MSGKLVGDLGQGLMNAVKQDDDEGMKKIKEQIEAK
jgi:hypothetical protein